MEALEIIQNEVVELRQINPIVKEVEKIFAGRGVALRVKEATAVRHDPVVDCKGYIIHVTLDEVCLSQDQLKSIMNIRGFEWISLWGNDFRIDFWRKEIA